MIFYMRCGDSSSCVYFILNEMTVLSKGRSHCVQLYKSSNGNGERGPAVCSKKTANGEPLHIGSDTCETKILAGLYNRS